jgi:peptide/nickel transport system substrate-binding protein
MARTRFARTLLFSLVVVTGLAGCAQGTAPGSPAPAAPAAAPAQATSAPAATGRTLVIGSRNEPGTIAGKPLRQAGIGLYTVQAVFSASLAGLDDKGVPRPHLAEAVPELNTDSWRVLPDGRMEMTWKLKPNLVWHDGTPLSAQDFVFGWRVYATPDLGVSASPPIGYMEEVTAPDERTVLITWARPYPDADEMTAALFSPLPRHILQQSHQEGQWEAFTGHPYWSREYVGLGPFALSHWEPGAYIEADAFDRYVRGKPKIPRVRFLFVEDPNTAVANVLGGEVNLIMEGTIQFEQAMTLKRRWEAENGGKILLHPNQWKATRFQLRPELATPRALRDARVRRAMAHAMDKEALNETLYYGDGLVAQNTVPPGGPFSEAVERATARYPYDLRRAQELMREAGFTKGSDGTYTSPSEGRFEGNLTSHPGTGNAEEISILAYGFREAGFEIREVMYGRPQAQDAQLRATFPGLYHNNQGSGVKTLLDHMSSAIPSDDTRWIGSNRGAWSTPEYDRLGEAVSTTLDKAERTRIIADMARIFSEELPAVSVFFAYHHWAHVAGVKGPALVAPGAQLAWNIHTWEFN